MPIAALLIYIVLTYCPLIYRFIPFLGYLKIVLVVGLVLLISFIATHNRYTNPTAYKHPIVYCWAVFLILMTLGIFVSVDRGSTLELIQLNLKHFLVFLVMVKIVDTFKRLQTVLLAFVSCGVCMGIGAIYSYVFNRELLASSSTQAFTGGYRAIALEGGIFADPNDLALLLNAVLPFAMYHLLTKKQKVLPLVGTFVLITGTMLTHSRAGFLGLCITGLTFLFLFWKGQKKYVMVLFILAMFFWSVAPESYKERISTITAWEVDETGRTGTRMDSWQDAMSEGLRHPVLGVGAGSGYYLNGMASNDWHSIHNAFVQVFVEIGIVGFIVYLLLFIISLKQYKIFIGNIDESAAKWDMLYKTLAVGILSFGTTAFFTPQAYSPLLYMLTALVVITSELIRKESNSFALYPTHLPEYQSPIHKFKGV